MKTFIELNISNQVINDVDIVIRLFIDFDHFFLYFAAKALFIHFI